MNNTSLRTSITKMLHEEFPDCDIYKDKQEAGTKLPAFYVRYVNVTQQGKGMDFYEQNYIVEVRHRPDPDMPPNEINDYFRAYWQGRSQTYSVSLKIKILGFHVEL